MKELRMSEAAHTHSELPDLIPWFDNTSDNYEELPSDIDYSYDE